MIASDLVIRKNPVIVIDKSHTIPDEIAKRVSFKSCSKIFVDTTAESHTPGNHIIVMKDFSAELINQIAIKDDFPSLNAIYVIRGLTDNLSIHGRIPVVSSQYAESRGITDPETQLDEFIAMISTDLGYTHIMVPWGNPTGSTETHWRVLSYGAETVQYTNKSLQTLFPYSAWVSSVVKKANYEQRKNDIIAMNKMLSSTSPIVDEFVLFGDDDFVTPERFPAGKCKLTYITRRNKQPVRTLGDIFEDAWSRFPKQSVVFITRGDITLNNPQLASVYCRLPNNMFGVLNPLTIPDVPDPKPELFQRGAPEVVYGCIYRTKKRPIPSDSILNKIHSHMMGSFGVAAELAKQRKIITTNPSLAIQTWVPTGTTPTFLKSNLRGVPQYHIPHGKIIYASLNETRTPVWPTTTDGDTSAEIRVTPILSVTGCTENRTLVNMTNKYTRRKGGDNWILDIEKGYETTVGSVSPFYDANDCVFYKDYWVHTPSCTGKMYNGSGVVSKYGHRVSNPFVKYDGILIGIPDTRITTFLGALSHAYNYINADSSHSVQPIHMITSSPVNDDMNVLLNKMFDSLDLSFKIIHIADGYIRGSTGNLTYCVDNKLNFLGYDPRVVRQFNRSFHSSRNDAIEDVLGDISPSRASSRASASPEDTRHTAVVVGSSKWRKCIKTELEQHTTIRVILAEDATRDDYGNASYIIGTSEGDDWAFTAFVNAETCRVIEIAPEYDCDVKWFHLAATSVGCEHMYLSLKQEPSKQCKKRIKTHLISYIREEDKVSSGETNATTSST